MCAVSPGPFHPSRAGVQSPSPAPGSVTYSSRGQRCERDVCIMRTAACGTKGDSYSCASAVTDVVVGAPRHV